MRSKIQSTAVRVLLIPGLALILAACDSDNQAQTSNTPNAPAFGPAGSQASSSPMSQLSYQLALLDRELEEDEYNMTEQSEVVTILTEMVDITSMLMAEDAGESHAFLQDDLAEFREQLGAARLAAQSDPPRYYLAGRIAGGCVNCHEVSL